MVPECEILESLSEGAMRLGEEMEPGGGGRAAGSSSGGARTSRGAGHGDLREPGPRPGVEGPGGVLRVRRPRAGGELLRRLPRPDHAPRAALARGSGGLALSRRPAGRCAAHRCQPGSARDPPRGPRAVLCVYLLPFVCCSIVFFSVIF